MINLVNSVSSSLESAESSYKVASSEFDKITSGSFYALFSGSTQSSKPSPLIDFVILPLKGRLSRFDQVSRGALNREFSMIETASAVKNAKIYLEFMTEIRKHLVSGLNQIINNTSA